MVAKEVQDRIDAVWSRLQKMHFHKGISQIELDHACAQWLETAVTIEEELMKDAECKEQNSR